MEAVILIGIQASGKSTFFQRHFASTHVRVNLDMLRTRHRERRLVETCLEIGQPFVVDNTNLTAADRARYLDWIKAAATGWQVAGYYLATDLARSLARNAEREPPWRLPERALLGSHKRLELPGFEEGFDSLYHVAPSDDGAFSVQEWNYEVR